MRQRFRPSEQRTDYLLDGRINALRFYTGAHLRELLQARNALHLDRFRPELGRSRRDELRDSEMDWEGED